MKTIKELSESVGISKVSLYKLLKREDIKGHVFKQGNVSVIDDIGELLIREHYTREHEETINDIVNDTVNDAVTNDTEVKSVDIISILQEQLKEKDNQINALLNIVTNQQKLQATQYLVDEQHIKTPPEPEDKPRQNFLQKLFKRG